MQHLVEHLIHPSSALHLPQRCLGLGQPECHLHVTVESHGGGECSAGLLPLAKRGIQCAEAEVAVRLERAHPQFFGQGEGLAVVISSLIALWGLTPRRNLTEEAQGIRLVTAFLVRTGEP
jgi:hypothetical protein